MHNLIVGMPQSGKSALAKWMANNNTKAGHKVVVFDPIKDSGWPKSAYVYHTPALFLREIWVHKNCYVYMDECKMLFDEDKREAEKLAYMGRHGGRSLSFIGTRAWGMIPPNARNMCSKVFAFKQQFQDAKILADNYNYKFMETQKLGKLNFLAGNAFEIYKGQLSFTENGTQVRMVNYE